MGSRPLSEQDGSGDYTFIQDALDAAAPGDTIMVGPGRYEDFRPYTSTIDGNVGQSIAYISTPGLTIQGFPGHSSVLGPPTYLEEKDGQQTIGIYVDGGAETYITGFRMQNVKANVVLRSSTRLLDCQLENQSEFASVTALAADITVQACQFIGPRGILGNGSVRLTVSASTFVDSTMSDFAIAVSGGAADCLVRDCDISSSLLGVSVNLGSSAQIERTSFGPSLIPVGVSDAAALMDSCSIARGAKFAIRVARSSFECTNSVIGGGTSATIFTDSPLRIRDSHILNSGGATIHAATTPGEVVDVSHNWWGTTSISQIESWIVDPESTVVYIPIRQRPVGTARQSVGALKATAGSEAP